jgi:hypothetical protein
MQPFCSFGAFGEVMVLMPREGEKLERTIALTPLRMTVVVTLRELRPLAGPGMQLVRERRVFLIAKQSKEKLRRL